MRSRRFTIPRRWPRLLFCLAWYHALSGLLGGQRYTAFLRPEFGWLLAIGALAFAVFGIVTFGDRKARMDTAELVRLGILLLPLAFLVQARGISLGHQAFENRYIGPHAPIGADGAGQRTTPSEALEGAVPSPPETLDGDEENTAPLAKPGVAGVAPAPSDVAPLTPAGPRGREESKAVTILDLHWGPELYRGHRVKLVGRLHRDARLADFGPNVVLVYRFVITCCAADALPATVLVDCSNAPVQADGDWVTVDGVVAVREHEEQGMLFIEGAAVTASPKPERPYLY